MNTAEAWTSFNLCDNNQDPGGSWLYAFRYDEQNLREHQGAVISALQGMGISMFSLPDGQLGMGADHDLSEDEMNRFMIMTEELSVTNEALEHSPLNLFGAGIVGLANTYKTAFATSLSMGDKSNAAAMLKIEIPQIVSDLSRAQEDSQPMSDIDYKAVLNLGDFAARKIAILMSGDGIMTISNFAPTQTLRLGDLPQV